MTVSKPYGDSARFDFVVGQDRPLHRVQVRSTRIFTNSRAWVCRFTRSNPPVRYSSRDFDFLALYVVPHDVWYVIPMSAIKPAPLYICVYPHISRSRGRWEQYREAWCLLTRPGSRESKTKELSS
jgi:hypothetical protein